MRILRPSSALTSALLLGACAEAEPAVDVDFEIPSFAHDLRVAGDGGAVYAEIKPWPRGQITYAIDELTPVLPEEALRAEIRAAFVMWSEATEGAVTFSEVLPESSPQLIIGFRASDHVGGGSCADAFTDPEGTIAHVFTFDSACNAGVMHLNRGLPWVVDADNVYGTYDVRTVLLHEIGHLLGLGHSPEPGHIMHTEYPNAIRRLTKAEGEQAKAALKGDAP